MQKGDADKLAMELVRRESKSEEFIRIEELSRLPRGRRVSILRALLDFGCKGQSVGAILSVREVFGRLPTDLAQSEIEEAFVESLDFDDEWEFRRFLELVEIRFPEFIPYFARMAERSRDEDVRALACEYLFRP